jgi:hypothetical protein
VKCVHGAVKPTPAVFVEVLLATAQLPPSPGRASAGTRCSASLGQAADQVCPKWFACQAGHSHGIHRTVTRPGPLIAGRHVIGVSLIVLLISKANRALAHPKQMGIAR